MEIRNLISSCKGTRKGINVNGFINKIVIDSREAQEGDLFVALVGERVDGHDFIKSAYENGCRVFLVNKNRELNFIKEDMCLIEVNDTEIALGDIAKGYKENFKIPFIGVTGSVGKTTTRDMIYSVVSSKFKTLKNEKNYNNQIGVPLTLFNLDDCHECAIVEMGMCGFNEIEYLANIVNPKIGVISNIGQSHIEKLGSQEGILQAKLEITKNFTKENLLVINGDDKMLSELKGQDLPYRLKSFGFGEDNDLVCKKYKTSTKEISFVCNIDGKDELFVVPTIGYHNILNSMSAILVGLELGLTVDEIRKGLSNYTATGMRLDVIRANGITIINDCYNASPDSMISALNILDEFNEGTLRKVAILGDMFEMGDMSEEGHRRVGKIAPATTDLLITVGKDSEYISDEALCLGANKERIRHYTNKENLLASLKNLIKKRDVILVKASRGMQLEDIVDGLKGLQKN